MGYTKLDTEKQILNVLMGKLSDEDKIDFANHMLKFVDSDELLKARDKNKDNYLNHLHKLIDDLRPENNFDRHIVKTIALEKFEAKYRFDDEVCIGSIEKVKITERNHKEGKWVVFIEYATGEGYIEEEYVEVFKGDETTLKVKR